MVLPTLEVQGMEVLSDQYREPRTCREGKLGRSLTDFISGAITAPQHPRFLAGDSASEESSYYGHLSDRRRPWLNRF